MTTPREHGDPRAHRDHEHDDLGVTMSAPSDHRNDDSHAAVEARLRDAIGAYADTVEPAPGAWARLNGRLEGHAHDPRRAVIAVFAGVGAVAAAIALVIAMAGRGGESGGSVDMRPAATPPVSDEVATSTTQPADTVAVQVYLIDQEAFNVGTEPYEVAVERRVPPEDPMKGALDALFAGPTTDEAKNGIIHVGSGATGVSKVTVVDGVARVYLEGACSSGGSTLTVASEIFPTVKQFEGVDAVKIYDADGNTEEPDGIGDSIPVCLEP